jgi:hypothetical protein
MPMCHGMHAAACGHTGSLSLKHLEQDGCRPSPNELIGADHSLLLGGLLIKNLIGDGTRMSNDGFGSYIVSGQESQPVGAIETNKAVVHGRFPGAAKFNGAIASGYYKCGPGLPEFVSRPRPLGKRLTVSIAPRTNMSTSHHDQ